MISKRYYTKRSVIGTLANNVDPDQTSQNLCATDTSEIASLRKHRFLVVAQPLTEDRIFPKTPIFNTRNPQNICWMRKDRYSFHHARIKDRLRRLQL